MREKTGLLYFTILFTVFSKGVLKIIRGKKRFPKITIDDLSNNLTVLSVLYYDNV